MPTFEMFLENQKTDHKWTDITSERYRVYEFVDKEVKIEAPVALSVSKSGGHRIFDNFGKSHYVAPGWKHLYWEVEDEAPYFVK